MDKVIGGVGIRRGRRHPDEIELVNHLTFWRVEIRRAGSAVAVARRDESAGFSLASVRSQFHRRMAKRFSPKRLILRHTSFWGFVYWYAMWPFPRIFI